MKKPLLEWTSRPVGKVRSVRYTSDHLFFVLVPGVPEVSDVNTTSLPRLGFYVVVLLEVSLFFPERTLFLNHRSEIVPTSLVFVPKPLLVPFRVQYPTTGRGVSPSLFGDVPTRLDVRGSGTILRGGEPDRTSLCESQGWPVQIHPRLLNVQIVEGTHYDYDGQVPGVKPSVTSIGKSNDIPLRCLGHLRSTTLLFHFITYLFFTGLSVFLEFLKVYIKLV